MTRILEKVSAPLKNLDKNIPDFTRPLEGTALGLAIVKKIAEAHDGSLEILDSPDRGVTFMVILPLLQK